MSPITAEGIVQELIERMWESDEANTLTNRAARTLETLLTALQKSQERERELREAATSVIVDWQMERFGVIMSESLGALRLLLDEHFPHQDGSCLCGRRAGHTARATKEQP